MRNKKPFIKKSRQSNLSFISKPNLSITKASHRFSLDRTFINTNRTFINNDKTYINTDRKYESYIKTARDNYN